MTASLAAPMQDSQPPSHDSFVTAIRLYINTTKSEENPIDLNVCQLQEYLASRQIPNDCDTTRLINSLSPKPSTLQT